MPLPTAGNIAPVKGKFAALVFGTNLLPGRNWSLNVDPKIEDTSNFLSGRLKTEQLDEATVTCDFHEDDTTPLVLGVITGGLTGILKLYTNSGATKCISLPVKVGAISPKNDGMEKALGISVTFHFSALWNTEANAWVNSITWQANG